MTDSEISLMDIINISYQEEYDEDFEDFEDFDKIDFSSRPNFLNFINENIDYILYYYIAERLSLCDNETLFLEVNCIDSNIYSIEIQKVELGDKLKKYYSSLSKIQNIKNSNLNNKEDIKKLIDNLFSKEGDLLIAEEPTFFFRKKISLNLESFSDINKYEEEIDRILKGFHQSINKKKESLFKIV